jgi:hypothetical protein
MESLPIVMMVHSNYIGPIGGWDLRTRKGASGFDCLQDR